MKGLFEMKGSSCIKTELRRRGVHVNKYVHAQKGVTLVELLVSIAILSIVAMPFLASFLTSAKNNMKSERILVVSNLAKKAMEEIKADPSRLKDEPNWKVFVSNIGEIPWTADPDIENYIIEYRVDETKVNRTVSNFELPEETEYDIYINVGFDYMTLQSSSYSADYPLSNESGAVPYTLSLLKSGSFYVYSINSGTDYPFVPDSGSIDIGIEFDEETGVDFILAMAADEEITLPVNVYIMDDNRYRLTLSTYGNDFNIFRSMSQHIAVPEFSSRVYSIDVRVKYRDGSVLNTITSMVKK